MNTYIQTSLVATLLRIVGVMTAPYKTYRDIIERPRVGEAGVIAGFVLLYMGVASMVKTWQFRPFLLTRHWIVLVAGALITYVLAVGLFWIAGRVVGGKGRLLAFAVGWAYSLLPTLLWFWITSVLYVVIPPPRTVSAMGVLFSGIYLIGTFVLFFWKITLSYLALRFGLRLDFGKIALISCVVLPLLAFYSVGMYRLGIFRVPFI